MFCCSNRALDLHQVSFSNPKVRRLGFKDAQGAIEVLVYGFIGDIEHDPEGLMDWTYGSTTNNVELRMDEHRINQYRFFMTICVYSAIYYGVLIGIDDTSAPPECKGLGAAAILYPPGKIPAYEGWNFICKLCRFAKKFYHLRKYEPFSDKNIQRRLPQVEKFSNGTKQKCQQGLGKSKVWYVQCVATHPGLQGKGLGKEIMKACDEVSEYMPLYLECTESKQSFYSKRGYASLNRVVLHDSVTKQPDEVAIGMIKHADDQISVLKEKYFASEQGGLT